MAKDETRRLRPATLAEDDDSFAAVQTLTDYAPSNPANSVASLTTAHAAMLAAQAAEAQAEAALTTARDVSVAAEWDYHNKVVAMRDSVGAQYGRNSNEVQAVGRKKASERNAPARKTPPA
ncbi:MAG TPA: hypothetical protein VF723_09090 [Pyrinomonadaceae bacterium]|jgi:hypothetical protein